jgi:hypothetical protein
MPDIEPMLEYNFSNFSLKTVYTICLCLYLAFCVPIYCILNYDIKTEKEIIKQFSDICADTTKPRFYRVSKQDIILDEENHNNNTNIMYFTNHMSISDFFIDSRVMHYTSKVIALTKTVTLLPLVSLIAYLSSYNIIISHGNSKEVIIKNLQQIYSVCEQDKNRILTLYPEGMRRPHRPNVSACIKKGFIYYSFEHNIPIQIIHTTNKDYVIDEQNLQVYQDTCLFTYYGSKIDPVKLRKKFEKKHKKEYTKDNYYEDVYSKWCKIWKRMDEFRIETYREKGLSYEECVKKMNELSLNYPVIENKILKNDVELGTPFLLVRSLIWSIIYFIIFKVIEKIFDVFHSCSNKTNQIIDTIKSTDLDIESVTCNTSDKNNNCCTLLSKLGSPFLLNLIKSPASLAT